VLYDRCVECTVAFVPGKYFFTQPGEGLATMRLNYTMIDEVTIRRAIRIVGDVIRQELERV
jgi:2-aminoadipate transaminase